MDEAKVQFASLVQQYPEDDELRFPLALVCLEAKPGTKPKGYLQDADRTRQPCRLGTLEPGRIAEERNDPQGALIEYAWSAPAMTICLHNCARPTS
jgi:hypothetical protein